MSTILYQLSNGMITEMTESSYDNEDDLQRIIADNPSILLRTNDSDDADRNGLYLIQREQGIHSLSLDHLMVDQDGVPVLVEVKRSSDERIYREVAAQMIDYASRVSTLDVGELKVQFEANNPDADERFLSSDFWNTVANNLKAERIKLVFAADAIPDSLKIIIEFLDRSMPDIEVYGVEIHQYKSGDTIMLSTEIIENTLTASVKATQSRGSWNYDSCMQFLEENGFSDFIQVWNTCLDKAEQLGISCSYGAGRSYPSMLLRCGGLTIAAVGAVPKFTYIEIDANNSASHLHCDMEDIRALMPDIPERRFTAQKVKFHNITSDRTPVMTEMLEELFDLVIERRQTLGTIK